MADKNIDLLAVFLSNLTRSCQGFKSILNDSHPFSNSAGLFFGLEKLTPLCHNAAGLLMMDFHRPYGKS